MIHGVSSGSGTHGDGSALDTIRIGHAGNRGNGPFSVVGLWTSELSDGNLDTLKSNQISAWAALSPAELITFENWNGTTGWNTQIGTSSLSSITGTVSVGADAPSFNFTMSSPSSAIPTPIVAPNQAAIRASFW
jgi:hypothetical protein